MSNDKRVRTFSRGISLLEVLIALAIIVILVGLILPAVQSVRESAARIKGFNNLKQITLAMHSYSDAHGGALPLTEGNKSTFYRILPFLEHGNYYSEVESGLRPYNNDYIMRPYIGPSDPSITDYTIKGMASYGYNALVYVPEVSKLSKPTIGGTFRDGHSNTVVLTEHYAFDCEGAQFQWMTSEPPLVLWNPSLNHDTTLRRSSFADVGDIAPYPQTPPTLTFQLRPRIEDCNPRIPQTPFHGGLLAGLADGSVRFLNPGISPATFWAAVTPAGGEVLGSDW